MTDKDIIMTLELCSKGEFFKNALDLINRQKAEIERLEKLRAETSKEVDGLKETNGKLTLAILMIKNIKGEAIKEFAERVKDASPNNLIVWGGVEYATTIDEFIDTLVKEMTEEPNNGSE